MGIIDFFLGRKSVETETEEIGFEDIGKWLERKDGDLRKSEEETFEEIDERLDEFYVSIEAKLKVLEGIDIEGKKEHERAKILVRQGLDKYVNSVLVLLKDLKKLEKEDLVKFAQEIGRVFDRFEKMSAKFYARATYLIGDEMMAVRNEIRRFYNEMIKLFEGTLIGNLKKVEDIRLKLGEFENVKNNFMEIKREIAVRDRRIEETRERVKKLEGEIGEIKGSSEYGSKLRVESEIKSLEVGLDREIGRLKKLVDFKRLTNIVHSNEREMVIVKDYRNHFAVEFGRDEGKRLFDLMSSCRMKSSEVEAQVALIKKRGKELDEKRKSVGVDYTVGKLDEIVKVGEERESIELENIKWDRRLEELRLRLKGLKNELISLMSEMVEIRG